MVFSYHIRYTFRNQPKGAFLLSEDLHQKSCSVSNQYKFLVVRVLRFWELGHLHLRHAEQIAKNVLRKSLYILTLMRSDAPISMDLKSRVHPTAQHARSIQRQRSCFDQERHHTDESLIKARGDSPSWKYLMDRAPDLAFGLEVGCGEFSRARK